MLNIAKQETFNWTHVPEVKSPLVELFLGGIKEAYWAEESSRAHAA